MSVNSQLYGIRLVVSEDGTKSLQVAKKIRLKGSRKYAMSWEDVPIISEIAAHEEDARALARSEAAAERQVAERKSVEEEDSEPWEDDIPADILTLPLFPIPQAEAIAKSSRVNTVSEPVLQTKPAATEPVKPVAPVVLTEVERVKMHKIWKTLSTEEKVSVKKTYGTTSAWFGATGGKRPALTSDKAAQRPVSPVDAPDLTEYKRTYGEDGRDMRSFKNLSPEEQVDALSRWADPYAWYLCEYTNIIAVGLRDDYDPSQLARQYRLTLEEVMRCKEVKKPLQK